MVRPMLVLTKVLLSTSAVLGLGILLPAVSRAGEGAAVEKYLMEGKLADAEAAMQGAIEKSPEDQDARFSLGVVQFLQAVEGLGQSLHQYGALQTRARMIPLLRMPVPGNEAPEEISYQDARAMVESFHAGLERAEASLAAVDTSQPVKLPLHVGLIRLDLDGDGEASEREMFADILVNYLGPIDPSTAQGFVIGFDNGDVHWLRGYCHLLMAVCDFELAHDFEEPFNHSAQLFFPKAKTPYAFLQKEKPARGMFDSILDVIAMIHLIDLPVIDKPRMEESLKHLESMVAQSQKSWDLILAEKDNDHEWIPSPEQRSVIPNVKVTGEMIDAWRSFLAETDALLQGKKLIPFWRGGFDEPQGVNLRKVFTEPTRFDLVLWVQGTAAVPYLEQGEMTDPQVWTRLQRVFRGEFIGFALWFN